VDVSEAVRGLCVVSRGMHLLCQYDHCHTCMFGFWPCCPVWQDVRPALRAQSKTVFGYRWDLHHAILRQGGYTEVAAALGRRRQGGNPFTGGTSMHTSAAAK
jgi:hypothetical protein